MVLIADTKVVFDKPHLERWDIKNLLTSYLGDAASCRWSVDRFVVSLGYQSHPSRTTTAQSSGRRRTFALILHGIRTHEDVRPPFPGDAALGLVSSLEFVVTGCDPFTRAVASGFRSHICTFHKAAQ